MLPKSPLPSEYQRKSPPERIPGKPPPEWHYKADKTVSRHRNAPTAAEEVVERHHTKPQPSEEITERQHRKHNTHENKERTRQSKEGAERHRKHPNNPPEDGHRRRKKHHSPSRFGNQETQHHSLPNNPQLEDMESNYPDLQVFHNSIRELEVDISRVKGSTFARSDSTYFCRNAWLCPLLRPEKKQNSIPTEALLATARLTFTTGSHRWKLLRCKPK